MLNKEVIDHFYNSFSKGDVAGMLSCYHDDIQFSDPAFGSLKGEEVKYMWQMLIERSKGAIKIDYSNFFAEAVTGQADWTADYIFTQTGRPVHNKVHADFEFKDGKIIRHRDSFNLYTWAKQALGFPAYFLQLTGILQKQVQRKSRMALAAYIQKRKSAEKV